MKLKNKLRYIDYKKEINRLNNVPRIIIKGEHHGIIEKKSLLELDKIYNSNNDIEIKSFEMFINNKTYYSANNKLTNNMKNEIYKLKIGDKIYFENIKAIFKSDKELRKIGTVVLKIK